MPFQKVYSCKPTGENIYIGRHNMVQNRDLYLVLGWKFSEYRKDEIQKITGASLQNFRRTSPPPDRNVEKFHVERFFNKLVKYSHHLPRKRR